MTPLAGGKTPGRTPMRTPARKDTIMMEAENLVKMMRQETPLLGGSLTSADTTSNPELNIIKPPTGMQQTPNVLAEALRQTPARMGTGTASASATPGHGGAGGQTPIRDQFSINEEESFALSGSSTREEKMRLEMWRQQLRAGLSKLSAPEFKVSISVPELPQEENEEEKPENEDAIDGLTRKQREVQAKEEAMLKKCSQTLQRGLPRPIVMENSRVPLPPPSSDPLVIAEREIAEEMRSMILFETKRFPPLGGAPSSSLTSEDERHYFEEFDQKELDSAKAMLDEETKLLTESNPKIDMKEFTEAWCKQFEELIYVPSTKTWGFTSRLPLAQKVEALRNKHEMLRRALSVESAKTKKLEDKMSILHGGYQARDKMLNTKLVETQQALSKSIGDLECFRRLRHSEAIEIPVRIETMQRELALQQELESANQQRYAELSACVTDIAAQINEAREKLANLAMKQQQKEMEK